LYRDLDKRFIEEEESYENTIEDLREKLYQKEERNITLEKSFFMKSKEV